MPVDPQIQALLDMGTGVPATNTLSVPEARAQYEGRIRLMAPPAAVAAVTERTVAGPGGDLRLRIYRPPGQGPFPLLAFFHGSGFVLCSLDTHDGMCRNLCAGAGCVVVSVDYRLAPEHKYPAGLDDCVFATRWIAEHAAELDGDARSACRVRRQRWRQSCGGRGAAYPRPRRPAPHRPVADLSRHRLPHAGHPVLSARTPTVTG